MKYRIKDSVNLEELVKFGFVCYTDEKLGYMWIYISKLGSRIVIYEQVEIIEEEKKIEKLCEYNRDLYILTDDPDLKIKYSDDYNNIAIKINEIIDVVNKIIERSE